MTKPAKIFFLVLFSLVVAPLSAMAAGEPAPVRAFLDALNAQYKAAGGITATHSGVSDDGGGDYTITGLKFGFSGKDGKVAIVMEKVALKGSKAGDGGAYSFSNVDFIGMTLLADLDKIGPLKVSVPLIKSTGFHVLPTPASGDVDFRTVAGTAVYENAIAPELILDVAGQTLKARNFVVNWSGDKKTGLGKTTVKMESFVLPVSAVPNPEFQKDMTEEFGIEQFDISFDGATEVLERNGKLDLAYALRLSAKKVGAIEFGLSTLDMPTALVAVLKDIQQGKQPKFNQIMPHLVGIKLKTLKLRFVDDNFVDKALQLAAKKQGTTADALKANGAALIQLSLGSLNAPEFTKSVIAAYNAFTSAPGNISVEAMPPAPVAIATIMGMIAAPKAAIEALAVKVEANK